MSQSFGRVVFALAAIFFLVGNGFSEDEIASDSDIVQLKTGEEIFVHQWKAGESADTGGDGLGPLHNDVSCIACHHQGGTGGAGGLEKNAFLLSLDPKAKETKLSDLRAYAQAIHPRLAEPVEMFNRTASLRSAIMRQFAGRDVPQGFLDGLAEEQLAKRRPDSIRFNTMIVLHKHSTSPGYGELMEKFSSLKSPILGDDAYDTLEATRQLATDPVEAYASENSDLRFVISQRNTPSLFGLGQVDSVPESYLRELADDQRKRNVVSGRVARNRPGAGKFGWKGQTATLEDFVRGACANELGLNVPGVDQPLDPSDMAYLPEGFDLSEQQVKSLTSFVASLPSPKQLTPADPELAKVARRGHSVFSSIGCAECHVEDLAPPKLTKVVGIYSDLLLHDMGQNLSDPVAPGGTSGSAAYYGSAGSPGFSSLTVRIDGNQSADRQLNTVVRPATKVAQQEWRTPPLWGVSATAPYMHDGRAATLTEAILYHGGEAKFSLKKYLTLPPGDRMALIEFMKTLVPPDVEEI